MLHGTVKSAPEERLTYRPNDNNIMICTINVLMLRSDMLRYYDKNYIVFYQTSGTSSYVRQSRILYIVFLWSF